MVTPEIVAELQAIAKEEWNRPLTAEQATRLAEWLTVVYRALLED